jgi:hypothetical protein
MAHLDDFADFPSVVTAKRFQFISEGFADHRVE